MAKTQGRVSKILVAGNTMLGVENATIDKGINLTDTTCFQDTDTQNDNILPTPSLSFSGYAIYTDDAQNDVRTASDSITDTTISGVSFYTTAGDYFTMSSTAKVSSYSEDSDSKGHVKFSCEIIGGFTPTYA